MVLLALITVAVFKITLDRKKIMIGIEKIGAYLLIVLFLAYFNGESFKIVSKCLKRGSLRYVSTWEQYLQSL